MKRFPLVVLATVLLVTVAFAPSFPVAAVLFLLGAILEVAMIQPRFRRGVES